MKNVSSISVKSLCFIFLFALCNVHAQEVAGLNAVAQKELSKAPKTDNAIVTAQSYTVKGIVVDHDNLPLGGVNVVLKGTKVGVVTDLDGKFEFPRKLDVDNVLVFSYIGYNPQEYVIVASGSETLDITITFDLSNISLMGAVEVEGVYKSKRNIFQKFAGLFK